MKERLFRARLLAVSLLIGFLTSILIPSKGAAGADEASAAIPVLDIQTGEIRLSAGEVLTGLVLELAAGHPWMMTALMVIGTLRLCVKPVMATLHAVARQTSSDRDDRWLARVEGSWGWTFFVFCVDWLASVKLVRAGKVLGALLVAALAPMLLAGCASLSGTARELKDDSAIVTVRIGSPWGTQILNRIGGTTNSVRVNADGSLEINPRGP